MNARSNPFGLQPDTIKKIDHWDRFLADRKRLEEKLMEQAEELKRHGYTVEPPRIISPQLR